MILAKNRIRGIRRGELHGRAKLTDHEVELIRRMVESGEWTQNQIALKFEISKSCVSFIVNYRRR